VTQASAALAGPARTQRLIQVNVVPDRPVSQWRTSRTGDARVENAMFDWSVRRVMGRRRIVKAAPVTTVIKAAKLIAARKIGAVMVVDGERLVGIFTERDLAVRVVARELDVRTTTLAEVMTADPFTVAPDQPFGYALNLMYEKGFRHLPVVENGKPIGIVSARSAMDPALEEFVTEVQRREHFRKDR